MSLFTEKHNDALLLSYIDIDSIRSLSTINKYYYNFTKSILKPFRIFYKIYHKLDIKIKTNIYQTKSNKPVLISTIISKIDKDYMLIKACIFNSIHVMKYIINKNNGIININIIEYLLEICVYKNNVKIAEYVINKLLINKDNYLYVIEHIVRFCAYKNRVNFMDWIIKKYEGSLNYTNLLKTSVLYKNYDATHYIINNKYCYRPEIIESLIITYRNKLFRIEKILTDFLYS